LIFWVECVNFWTVHNTSFKVCICLNPLPLLCFANAPRQMNFLTKKKNRKKRKLCGRWRGLKTKRKRNKCRRLKSKYHQKIKHIICFSLCRSLLVFKSAWACVSHLILLHFLFLFFSFSLFQNVFSISNSNQ
jgi:hypothetical protein